METHRITDGTWPFEADMVQRAGGDPSRFPQAWCDSALAYIEQKTQGKLGNMGGGTGCANGNMNSNTTWFACVGYSVDPHSALMSRDTIFISTTRLDVSTLSDNDDDFQSWCTNGGKGGIPIGETGGSTNL